MPTLTVPYSSLVYDKKTGQYRAPNGQFLPRGEVRRRLDADIEAVKPRMEKAARVLQEKAQQLLRGEIGQSEYIAAADALRKSHALEIKYGQLASVAAAKGGFHATGPADYLTAAREIKAQYRWWENRIQTAATNPEYAARAAFVVTVASYADAGVATYEAVRLDEDLARGLNWEINILDDGAIHCKPKGDLESCEQQTEKGAVKSGTLVRHGGCACRNKCRCRRERFKTEAEAAAYL